MTTKTELTPTQALGVLLSVQAETMTMDEAQDRAPNMLDHLHRLGYELRPSGLRLTIMEFREDATADEEEHRERDPEVAARFGAMRSAFERVLSALDNEPVR